MDNKSNSTDRIRVFIVGVTYTQVFSPKIQYEAYIDNKIRT